MTLKKKLTTVTPFSKFLAMILFIALPFLGFFLGFNLGSTNAISLPFLSISQSTSNSTLPVVNKSQNYQLVKAYGKIFFIDKSYNYQLDLSSLPQIFLTDPDTDQIYVFDLYAKKSDGRGLSSVARFGISKPHDNEKLSLEDFAKNKLMYVEGKDRYGVTTNSKISQTYVSHNYKGIFWDSTSTLEGPSNTRHYLLNANSNYIHFQLYSWNQTDYNRASSDFEKVLSSFEVRT